jgi:putative ABC transport system permease protein
MPTLTYLELILIASLSLATGVFAWKKGWEIHRPLWISTARSLVQMSLLGLALNYIFRVNWPLLTLISITLMTIIASIASTGRLPYQIKKQSWYNLLSLLFSTWPITFFSLIVMQQFDLKNPAVILPFAGMVLGNSLNGIGLGIERFLSELMNQKQYFISMIAFGATTEEASEELVKQAMKISTTPIINSMTVAGIVSVPGMMSGQILAGVDPLQSALYQFVIMVAVSCSILFGAYWGIKFTAKELFQDAKGFAFLMQEMSEKYK